MLLTSTADNRRLERLCHEFTRRRHRFVRRFLRTHRSDLPATEQRAFLLREVRMPVLAARQHTWVARAGGCEVAQNTRGQPLTAWVGLRPWPGGQGRSLLPLSRFPGCTATRRLRDDLSALHPSSLHPWMSRCPCRAPHADGPWRRAHRTSGRSRRSPAGSTWSCQS